MCVVLIKCGSWFYIFSQGSALLYKMGGCERSNCLFWHAFYVHFASEISSQSWYVLLAMSVLILHALIRQCLVRMGVWILKLTKWCIFPICNFYWLFLKSWCAFALLVRLIAPRGWSKMEVMDTIVYGQHWFSGSGSETLAVPLLTCCHAFLRIPSHLLLDIWMPLAF